MHSAQDITQIFPQFWTFVLAQALNLVGAIVILCIGWMAANASARWTQATLARVRQFDATLKPLVASFVRYSILGFTLIAVLERFGVQTASIIAVLGATGIAVGLALQGTLSNVASGVMLLLLRAFRVGDEINVAGFVGAVREVGLFRTVIISTDGLYVSIPNSALFSGAIVNNSREPTRLVSFKLTIDHSQDISKAQDIVLSALHANPRVLKNPPPGAPVTELGEFEITLTATAWTLTSNWGKAAPELQKSVRDRFREAGIKSPQRPVSIGGASSLPAQAAAAEEAVPKRRTA